MSDMSVWSILQRWDQDSPQETGLGVKVCDLGVVSVLEGAWDLFGRVSAIFHRHRQGVGGHLLARRLAGLTGDLFAEGQAAEDREGDQRALTSGYASGRREPGGATHTSQGNGPTKMVTSSMVAVSRSFPVMVITVPPAAGPRRGLTSMGLGSLTRRIIHIRCQYSKGRSH